MAGEPGKQGMPPDAIPPSIPPEQTGMIRMGQEQIDALIKERSEALANAQLADHKKAWESKVEKRYAAELADLRTFKETAEAAQLTEVERLQKEADSTKAEALQLRQSLFQARWDNAKSFVLHQAQMAGTSILPQFMGNTELTGSETPEELQAKAFEVAKVAYDTQTQALQQVGYQRGPSGPQPPGATPGLGVSPYPSGLVQMGPGQTAPTGGPPMPGATGPPGNADQAIWSKMQGLMRGKV